MSNRLVKHAMVYAVGYVATRFGSVLLLPVYTRFLTPSDYGIIALIDVTVGILSMFIGGYVASAATRQHFVIEMSDRPALWWSAVALVAIINTVVLVPAASVASWLGDLALGGGVARTGEMILLALATLYLNTFEELGLAHLRTLQRSTEVASWGVARLVVNGTINMVLLTQLNLGVFAILWGNAISAALFSCFALLYCFRPHRISTPKTTFLSRMWRYSAPFLISGFMAFLLHQSGRVLLRKFDTLETVGLFGLAQTIAQGVSAAILAPFSMIFLPVAMERAVRDINDPFFTKTFDKFTALLAFTLLTASILGRAAFPMLFGEGFAQAATYLPMLCVAYFFFGLHAHFALPAMIKEKTNRLILSSSFAFASSWVLGWILVPIGGAQAAAVAAAVGMALYAFGALALCRSLIPFPYNFRRLAAIGVICIGTWLVCLTLEATLNKNVAVFVECSLLVGLLLMIWKIDWPTFSIRTLLVRKTS